MDLSLSLTHFIQGPAVLCCAEEEEEMSEGKPAQEFPDRTLPISSSTHHASEKTNGCGGRGRSSNAGPRGCKHGNDGVSSREESNWITWKSALPPARQSKYGLGTMTHLLLLAAWTNLGRRADSSR